MPSHHFYSLSNTLKTYRSDLTANKATRITPKKGTFKQNQILNIYIHKATKTILNSAQKRQLSPVKYFIRAAPQKMRSVLKISRKLNAFFVA